MYICIYFESKFRYSMIILVISYLCFPFNGKDTGIGHQRRLDGKWGTRIYGSSYWDGYSCEATTIGRRDSTTPAKRWGFNDNWKGHRRAPKPPPMIHPALLIDKRWPITEQRPRLHLRVPAAAFISRACARARPVYLDFLPFDKLCRVRPDHVSSSNVSRR